MTPAAGTATDRCQRRDAQENRRRILDAARESFAQDGLDVSLIDIARRAGVGNATVHRNFTKESLVDALFDDWLESRRAAARRALEDPDPWHGLTDFLEDVVADAGRNRALLDIFMIRMRRGPKRGDHPVARLVHRAQEAGALRSDATAEDVFLIVWGLARTLAVTGDGCSMQARRQLAIALDGLRARPEQPPLPGQPVGPRRLGTIVDAWAQDTLGRRRCDG
jgi:AcrR family transcriptional regulator